MRERFEKCGAYYVYLRAEIVTPRRKVKVIKDDPSDNKFLECALEGQVDYVVSGDSHLLELEEFGGIKILNVADFMDLLTKER